MSCETCPIKGKEVRGEIIRADICIVGESPGREEEIEGRPFVGPSGKLLNRMLETYLGVKRAEVAVLNACRCQIPQELKRLKTYLKRAITDCRDFLIEDLKQVRPKVVIALGEVALSQIMGKWVTLSRNRGRLIDVELDGMKFKVFPTYHPSYILRNGGSSSINPAWVMWEKDWKILKQLIESDFTKAKAQFLPYTGNSVFKRPVVAVDCEWDEEGNLLVFSISDGIETRYVSADTLDPVTKQALRNLFRSKKFIVFANRPVDERILERYGIKLVTRKIDVFNMANLVNENVKINLETIANLYTNEHNIKEIAKRVDKKVWLLKKDELIEYNCIDTRATAKAFYTLYKELKKDLKLLNYWQKFILPVEEMLADITKEGFPIDREKLLKNKADVEFEKMKLEMSLIDAIHPVIKERHQERGLKLTRGELIRDWLFNSAYGLRLKPKKFTPTGLPAVDEGSLQEYQSIPWVRDYLEWKKLHKLLTTYFDGLLRNIHSDGRIYPNLVLYGSTTGRTVCFNPNIQQVPRSGFMVEKLKELYEAPAGWVICARDLSQSELRIVAWHANEKNMLKAMKAGVDLHSLTASLLLGKDIAYVTKEDRQLAKAVNFGLIYGQRAEGLMEYARENYGVDMSLEEAERFRKKFFEAYPSLNVYHRRCIEIARKYKQIRSCLGRIRRLPHIDSDDYSLRSQAERQAINFPIQSFSSDLGLIGMWLFWRQVKDKKDIRLLWFIHDAVFFMCKEEKVDEYMALLKRCMEVESKKYILKNFNVRVRYPIESDGKVGKNWAALTEWKPST